MLTVATTTTTTKRPQVVTEVTTQAVAIPGNNGYCASPEGRRIRCYGLKPVTCTEGCDIQDSGFDCKNRKDSKNNFVLVCPLDWVGDS